ncbi:hypothetical protein F4604DRAFT_1929076 [Suillus subluteus]|nr:hypothetical protein F4604DRAFT_1929076 [Suillus subluteus]
MHDFDDSTLVHGGNDNRYQDNNALDTLLFSQFLQMDAQQRGIANCQHYDRRTQTQCNLHAHNVWSEQLSTLIDAYLLWKHGSCKSDGDDHTADYMFEVCGIGIMDLEPSLHVSQRPDEPANAVLLHLGLLGCSPIQPTVAICLECLEVYHQIHRQQSSFSIQAITKVLCALHNVTYSSSFWSQFAIVFDIYLEILCYVQQQVNIVLKRDPKDWHFQGACLCCAFEQPNEPQLIP